MENDETSPFTIIFCNTVADAKGLIDPSFTKSKLQ